MFTGEYNFLPAKEKKSNQFSMRLNDKDHNALLFVAHLEGSQRAVTARDLYREGLKKYAQERGIDLSEQAVTEYLVAHGYIEPTRRR